MKKVLSVLTLTTVVAGVGVSPVAAKPVRAEQGTFTNCAHFRVKDAHVLEACIAYLGNNSAVVRRSYYENAHNSEEASWVSRTFYRVTYGCSGSARTWAQLSACALRYRYRGAALRQIIAQAARWPSGDNHVPLPYISIVAKPQVINSNTVRFFSVERWSATTATGTPLSIPSGRRVVVVQRQPGLALHVWRELSNRPA